MKKESYENWWPIFWRKMVAFHPEDTVKFFGKERPVQQVRTIADWGLSSLSALLVIWVFALVSPAFETLLTLRWILGFLTVMYLLFAVPAVLKMRKKYPVEIKHEDKG